MKLAVVYWSGTGNTELMAKAMAEGAKAAGAEVELLTPDFFPASKLADFDSLLLGCPAMGNEVLEEAEFEPMFTALEKNLAGVPVGLFGSYGWGDGEWMRSWESNCTSSGLQLACESVICQDAPDDDALHACAALANALK